jgi:hypothetical protein
MRFIGRAQGFTLLELQVAMVILIMGLYGMSRSLVSVLEQMRWQESSHPLYSYVPQDVSKVILSEIVFPGSSSAITQRIQTVESVHLYTSSMTAVVTPAEVF